MIEFDIVQDNRLQALIKNFDEFIEEIRSRFCVDLKSYGNILRIALNAIQSETFDNLLERIKFNRELERGLDTVGGYTIDVLEERNPKASLIEIVTHLKDGLPKLNQLKKHLQSPSRRLIFVVDANDVDFLGTYARTNKTKIMSLSEFLKKTEVPKETVVFSSFNGVKDFDLIYNLKAEVLLVLYEQENELFQKELQRRKKQIEEEVMSPSRLAISGLVYEPIPDMPIHVSQTIDDIVNRIDELGTRAYNGYKNDSESLLDDIEEKIIYKINLHNGSVQFLDSNDTLFDASGDFLKVYKVNVGDKIRVYPKEQFAEKLYNVAVETEPDVFGRVEQHSALWKEALHQLRKTIRHEGTLYHMLKEKGLRVLQSTVDSYFTGSRKFPMFKSDLRAIFKLRYGDKPDNEIDSMLKPLLKSKAAYNGTMIALGRGLKQELKIYLKEKRVGEILEQQKFDAHTLQKFVDSYMPLLTVVDKEVYETEDKQLNILYSFQS